MPGFFSVQTSVYQGLIQTFRHTLPIDDSIEPVSLCEGGTPLIPLPNLSRELGLELYAKFEGLNPTGSFKDRGMTLAVTMAKAQGIKAVICASTGNTSASAAAYAARASLACVVLIPEGKIAFGKLSQAIIHGARVLQIAGNFDHGMQLVKQLSTSLPLALVNSVNPYRLQGQKTIAFEVFSQLGRAPDYHALPVGNAANISAHWMGYCELAGEMRHYPSAIEAVYAKHPVKVEKQSDKRPVMLGYQAEGAAPLVLGHPVENPETIATAIRIGKPQSTEYALASARESGGWFRALSDRQLLKAQQLLAAKDGVFCEPASAISLAGVIEDLQDGRITTGSTLVLTLTGNGIKDPDTVTKYQLDESSLQQVEADYDAIGKLIGAVI